MEHSIALQFVVVLAIGTASVALCQRLGLSPIVGYLACGVLVGPSALGWLSDGPTTRLLAELGVVLLLFTIGLEFSVPRLLAAKRLVLGLGGAQVLATALLFGLLCTSLGLAPTQALVIGVALAMSSTALVLKQLDEQMELGRPHGSVVTAILLFQDIATVPVLIALPILAADPAHLGFSLALAFGKASLLFLGLVLAGRRLLPPILHWVASTRSLELFMLTALLMAVAAAGLSDLAGLPPTLGAFMAGMLLGETPFRHQVEADIKPFRDLMLGLFFATIGMQFEPAVFASQPAAVTLVLLATVVAKPLILVPLIRLITNQASVDAWRAAIAVGQGGEFSLLVVAAALGLAVIDQSLAQPVLAGLILSMLLAPLMLRFSQRIAARLPSGGSPAAELHTETHIADESRDFERHVIVCGFGRLGRSAVRILADEGIAALALDLDAERVREGAATGQPVIYGNAAQPGVLRAAGLERARALVITMDDPASARRIVSHVRGLGLDLPVLVRNACGRDDELLIEAGATVFSEGMESSLAFVGQMLIMLSVPPSQVASRLAAIRAEGYAPPRMFASASAAGEAPERSHDRPEQMRATVISEGSSGRAPRKLELGQDGIVRIDARRAAFRVPGRFLDR